MGQRQLRHLSDLTAGERERLEREVRAREVSFRNLAGRYSISRNAVSDLANEINAPSERGERHWRDYPIRTAVSVRLRCELCGAPIERGERIRRSHTIAAHTSCVDRKIIG